MKDWTPFRAVRRALRAFGRTKPCDPSTLRRSLPMLVIPRHPRIITAFHHVSQILALASAGTK